MRAGKSAHRRKRETPKRPPSDRDYSGYVEHPRYGREPRFTGLDVPAHGPDATLHWRAIGNVELERGLRRYCPEWFDTMKRLVGENFDADALFKKPDQPSVNGVALRCRIPGTAIEADPSRQNEPTVPVTHYYDMERLCLDCQRPFIFFAEEQKHWYEVLRLPLDADCVRCWECRKKQQALERKQRRYEELTHVQKRSWRENLEMAECALSLVEKGVFHPRQTEHLAALLKTIPESDRGTQNYRDARARLQALRAKLKPAKGTATFRPC